MKGTVPELPWITKYTDAQVPNVKWHRTVQPLASTDSQPQLVKSADTTPTWTWRANSCSLKKYPHINGHMQFKLELLNSQLYLHLPKE